MASFVMLTKLSHFPGNTPDDVEKLEKEVKERVASHCPDVEWQANYAVTGPYDYLDVFTAPDLDTAMRVSMIVRSFGHATTELWGATEWSRFKKMADDLPKS